MNTSHAILTIGRNESNKIVLSPKNISSKHAQITEISENEYFLEDLNSTNGTFVNGERIVRKQIFNTDTISFANNNYALQQLLSLSKNDNQLASHSNNFSSEFQKLRKIFEEYPLERKSIIKIEKDVRFYSIIASSLIALIAGVFSYFLGKNNSFLFILSIISSLGISILVPALVSRLLKTDEKLERLDEKFKAEYKCPNPDCNLPFGNKDWQVLATQKKCRNCKCIWVE